LGLGSLPRDREVPFLTAGRSKGGGSSPGQARSPLVAVAAEASLALPPGTRAWPAVTVGLVLLAATGLAFLLPWNRLPGWGHRAGAADLYRVGAGAHPGRGTVSGVGIVLLVPLIWTALFHHRSCCSAVITTGSRGPPWRPRTPVVTGSAALTAELEDLAQSAGLRVRLVSEPGLPQARAALSSGQLDMVVDGTGIILVRNPISASDTSAGARYVRDVSLSLGEQRAFAQAGLTPGQAALIALAGRCRSRASSPARRHARHLRPLRCSA
jgi:hypothetical protein